MYEVVEHQVLQELYSRWLLSVFAVHQYLGNHEAMMLRLVASFKLTLMQKVGQEGEVWTALTKAK